MHFAVIALLSPHQVNPGIAPYVLARILL